MYSIVIEDLKIKMMYQAQVAKRANNSKHKIALIFFVQRGMIGD